MSTFTALSLAVCALLVYLPALQGAPQPLSDNSTYTQELLQTLDRPERMEEGLQGQKARISITEKVSKNVEYVNCNVNSLIARVGRYWSVVKYYMEQLERSVPNFKVTVECQQGGGLCSTVTVESPAGRSPPILKAMVCSQSCKSTYTT